MLKRESSLLIKTNDLKPSDPRLKIIGVFNPGVARYQQKVMMIVRVAEGVKDTPNGQNCSPRVVFNPTRELEIECFVKDANDSDPRKSASEDGLTRLNFISRLALIELNQRGNEVEKIADLSAFLPQNEYEEYGVEDPRISKIDGTYYITYVSVSRKGGISTSLMSTQDFENFTRLGIIFDADTKDVVLFPQKIKGKFAAYLRPTGFTRLERSNILLSYSNDLTHWGEYKNVFSSSPAGFDSSKLGPGCPPLLTKKGWLNIYHGVEKTDSEDPIGVYSAGAFLTEIDAPEKVIARTKNPIMVPFEHFETTGFAPYVVFPTGIIQDHLNPDIVHIYYGAADTVVGHATLSLIDILNAME